MPEGEISNYFVDEAGDLTLFNKRGQSQLGKFGVSSFFMVGVAKIPDPVGASEALENLRAELLRDPYFEGVPSMDPKRNRTAVTFHAKNDPAEVRREVFKLLPSLGAKVQVAIRRKDALHQEAMALFRYRQSKMNPDDVYDKMVMWLFRDLLHKADGNRIVFARRGKSTRAVALEHAIERAKRNFMAKHKSDSDKPTSILSGYPSEYAGLQIVDYYLWALQRLYERGEDRFFNLLRGDFRLIRDFDDKREKDYGRWYSDKNPLTLEKIKVPSTD
jgi:hypothetical protein